MLVDPLALTSQGSYWLEAVDVSEFSLFPLASTGLNGFQML